MTPLPLRPVLSLLALVLVGTGCFRTLNPRDFSSSSALFLAGKREFDKGKWQNAINAFERLTVDLPTRDTLLAPSHWFLGQARLRKDERLLAAQSFMRLAEAFPQDTLADDALLASGDAYRGLWRRPALDPQYGHLAQTQYRLLAGVYPDSPLADTARARVLAIDEMLAGKDYETAMHYIRRRAYDSAVLYLRDVVQQFPETDKARQAMLRLVEVYRLPSMNYREDAEEVCAALRAGFPNDREVLALCKARPAPAPVPADSGR
jgi:outer membrane protein assembly factor BamD